MRSVKHGLSYDLKGNQRSDQKIHTPIDYIIRHHCLWIRPLVMEVQEFVLSAGPVEKLFFCNLQVQKNTRIKYLRLKQ